MEDTRSLFRSKIDAHLSDLGKDLNTTFTNKEESDSTLALLDRHRWQT